MPGGLIGNDIPPVFVLPSTDPGFGGFYEQRVFLTHLLYRDGAAYRKREEEGFHLLELQDSWGLVGTAFDYGDTRGGRVRACILRSDLLVAWFMLKVERLSCRAHAERRHLCMAFPWAHGTGVSRGFFLH